MSVMQEWTDQRSWGL